MTAVLLVSISHIFFLLGLSALVTSVLIIQLAVGVWNVIKNWHRKHSSHHHSIFNLYVFHHLIVSIIRGVVIVLACLSIVLFRHCLSIEILIHFLLLLATFDLLLVIVGETAHFWDSTINHKSTLYSRCCLIFGLILNYFVAILFLSIHVTMNGDHPFIVELCRVIPDNGLPVNEKSLIPTIITYVLFLLTDVITLSWIYISYRDISNLKRKRLATIFFSSLVFTHFKEHERLAMVNHSLKRLFNLFLFVISNVITILPIITVKLLRVPLNTHSRVFFIYFTTLPWIDCIAFFLYDEIKLNAMKLFAKRSRRTEAQLHQQRIGRRLSSYRECVPDTPAVEQK